MAAPDYKSPGSVAQETYTVSREDAVAYGEIHHPPWTLQSAELELRPNSMTESVGLELPQREPTIHFARYQQRVAWPLVSGQSSRGGLPG